MSQTSVFTTIDIKLSLSLFINVCVCVYVCMYVCMCVCVCVLEQIHPPDDGNELQKHGGVKFGMYQQMTLLLRRIC
jgi:hypothetical protein